VHPKLVRSIAEAGRSKISEALVEVPIIEALYIRAVPVTDLENCSAGRHRSADTL
jgi:hypothetical protein